MTTDVVPFARPYDSRAHQVEAGKLGIWLLIATEMLFFSGLFCAYAVCRAGHPEVFVYAHYFLNIKIGFFSTSLLLVSSLTAAWAVRSAQRGHRRALMVTIALTIACALGFLTLKGVEYFRKYEQGLLPGARFSPTEQVWELETFQRAHPRASEFARVLRTRAQTLQRETARLGEPEQVVPLLEAGVIGEKAEYALYPSLPQNGHLFFGLYFFMTALHALHVIVGIGVWLWLLVRAGAGVFGPVYFEPVNYTALYWHMVDLIWIYLFPLLYLIR